MKTFEEKAELFWRQFGYYPPGKDNPVGIMVDDDVRWESWIEFLREIDQEVGDPT